MKSGHFHKADFFFIVCVYGKIANNSIKKLTSILKLLNLSIFNSIDEVFNKDPQIYLAGSLESTGINCLSVSSRFHP